MSGPAAERRPLHILLVEDSPDDVEITQIALSHIDIPVRLSIAETGPSALAKICSDNDDPLDLVLLDINLPLMGGLDVLDRAKSTRGSACVPILILTTSSSTEEIAEATRRGAGGYYTKPFRFDEFTSMLRGIIETHAHPRGAIRGDASAQGGAPSGERR